METPLDMVSPRDRWEMVNTQVSARGLRNSRVISAMLEVPRERFVPPALVAHAYEDRPLPIGEGQTISQPYVVAWMADAANIDAGSRVLEIGTGSGYGAAVLAEIARKVISVERLASFVELARKRLAALGYDNVTIVEGDGSLGYADGAPYDAIVVTAGAPRAPEALLNQLAPGGRLVIPIGPREAQKLVRITRSSGSAKATFSTEVLGEVVFVPLLGSDAHKPGEPLS